MAASTIERYSFVMPTKRLTRISLTLLAMLLCSQPLLAKTDYDTARKLRKAGDILPLESILHKLAKTHPGKVLEVELETKHGKILYEIELLDQHGKVWQLKVDPRTGSVVKQKTSD